MADVLISTEQGDQGPISAATQTPGYPLNVFDWNLVLYGVLIIVFLIFEPLGPVRHLDPDPQLLEAVAVQLLVHDVWST